MMKLKLSDEVVAAIARQVQLGILTGTDVVDHLRLLELEVADGSDVATLTDECKERVQKNVDDLLEQARRLSTPSDAN